jgi:hypothetical protein
MKKLIALTILALTASTAATANEHGGGMKKHGGWMKKFDADGNGVITRAEADAAHDAKFKSMDTNGDGSITKEEREAHHAKMKQEHQARKAEVLGKYDTDKDGKLSDAEKEVLRNDRKAARESTAPAAPAN